MNINIKSDKVLPEDLGIKYLASEEFTLIKIKILQIYKVFFVSVTDSNFPFLTCIDYARFCNQQEDTEMYSNHTEISLPLTLAH
jgi:hypothetical protein